MDGQNMIVSSSRTRTERIRSSDSGSSPVVKFCITEDVISLPENDSPSSSVGATGPSGAASGDNVRVLRMASIITGMTRYIRYIVYSLETAFMRHLGPRSRKEPDSSTRTAPPSQSFYPLSLRSSMPVTRNRLVGLRSMICASRPV